MINATQIRKGMIIEIEGELYLVLETSHVTPGKADKTQKAQGPNTS